MAVPVIGKAGFDLEVLPGKAQIIGFGARQRDGFAEGFVLGLPDGCLGGARRCAIMCLEAVWWRCHRRFVADYLLHRGRDVFHLMGAARVDAATMNPAARVNGVSLVYPEPVS